MNFIELCLNGDLFEDEIDDFIEKWHNGEIDKDLELHDSLGMSWDEYSLWLTNPSILSYIISAHKHGLNLADELNKERYLLAARAESPELANKMDKWLKEIGKL